MRDGCNVTDGDDTISDDEPDGRKFKDLSPDTRLHLLSYGESLSFLPVAAGRRHKATGTDVPYYRICR